MQTLMNALGYQFKNPSLLRQALTHPSMGKDDNQRQEFGCVQSVDIVWYNI